MSRNARRRGSGSSSSTRRVAKVPSRMGLTDEKGKRIARSNECKLEQVKVTHAI
jgi:hypothetical protein